MENRWVRWTNRRWGANALISPHREYEDKNDQFGPTKLPTNPHDILENRAIRGPHRRWAGWLNLGQPHIRQKTNDFSRKIYGLEGRTDGGGVDLITTRRQ